MKNKEELDRWLSLLANVGMIATLVERHSRYVLLARAKKAKTPRR